MAYFTNPINQYVPQQQTTSGSQFYPTVTQSYKQPVTPSVNPNINAYASSGIVSPQKPAGQILGATTGGGSTGSGSTGGSTQQQENIPSGPSPEEQARIDAENRIRGEMGGAWDSYISGLDQQISMLGEQRGGMEASIAAQRNQAVNQLGSERETGLGRLGMQREATQGAQEKAFRNIDENQANQMRAGNIFLGARGAGDSSAANMYSYALGRQGSQLRGDVMNQTANTVKEIAFREQDLDRVYNTEIKNNQEEYNKEMGNIATWFAQGQQQIAQMKNEAGRDRGLSLAQMSYDLLNQAKQRVQQLQDFALQKQSAIEQWAMNNSNTINQAKQNLAGVYGTYAPSPIQMGAFSTPTNAMSNQNNVVPMGMGQNTARSNRSLLDLYNT